MLRPERGRDDLFDCAPDPGAVLDVAGAIEHANPALAELCGRDANDLVGRDFGELLHREDREAFNRGHARALSGGGGVGDEYEARVEAPSGPRWVAWRARAVGRQVVLAGRDITHTEHAPTVETSVSRLDARLEQLSKSLPESPGESRWGGWLQAGVAAAVAIFGAGAGWAAWQGQNATDADVDAAVETLKGAHQHYEAVDAELRATTQANSGAIEELSEGQDRLRQLAEYQYEFAQWRAKVEDARARGRRPPGKPPRLEDLEAALLTGKDPKKR